MFILNNKISKNVLVNCDHGFFIVNRFDYDKNLVGQSRWILDHGHASAEEAQIAYSNIKNKEPIIFDIGCNIGTFTSWVARAYPEGKIYSFEPQRLIFQMACGNMAINNLENIYLFNLALGKENKTIEIQEPNYLENNDYGRFSLKKDNFDKKSKYNSIVEIIKLDDFVEKNKIKKIDFIKIDAEGMDLEVLLGAQKSINKFRPNILVEHNDDQTSILEDLKSELNKYNYKLSLFNNNLLAILD